MSPPLAIFIAPENYRYRAASKTISERSLGRASDNHLISLITNVTLLFECKSIAPYNFIPVPPLSSVGLAFPAGYFRRQAQGSDLYY
jgi:hypothetical protein